VYNEAQELKRYFKGKPEVASKLPNINDVDGDVEVFMRQSNGTYKLYHSINSKWYKMTDGTNDIIFEEI